MGTRVRIGGQTREVSDYSVSEASTPLRGDDSSGSVGEIDFTTDSDVVTALTFPGETVTLDDSLNGNLSGVGVNASGRDSSNSIGQSWVANGILGKANIYKTISAKHGNLKDVFESYLADCGITNDVDMDDKFATREVAYPAFTGNVWLALKHLAIAQRAEISVVNNTVVFRDVRTREARARREADLSWEIGDQSSVAKSFTVYYYQPYYSDGGMVWPQSGAYDTTSITVDSGGATRQVLTANGSLETIFKAVCVDDAAVDTGGGYSYYSVRSGDSSIKASDWTAHGGSVSVGINPNNPTEIIVEVSGASGINDPDGNEFSSYSLELADGETSLHVMGTGVFTDKQSVTISTGINPELTDQDTGTEIDNPFIATAADAYTIGLSAVAAAKGSQLTLSGTLGDVNQRGVTGAITIKTYGSVKADYVGKTYVDIKTANMGVTYGAYKQALIDAVKYKWTNQTFGNVCGARYFYRPMRRWFRIREATVTQLGIDSVSMDDDYTITDWEAQMRTVYDTTYRWTGTPNASTSQMLVDGVVTRTNLATDPGFVNGTSRIGSWPGTGGVATTASGSASWAEMGNAAIRTTTTVATGADFGITVGQMGLQTATLYALSFRVWSSVAQSFTGLVRKGGAQEILTIQSQSGAFSLAAGESKRVWALFSCSAPGDGRIGVGISKVGDVGIGDVLLETGTTVGDFFSGDTISDSTPTYGNIDKVYTGKTYAQARLLGGLVFE